MKTKLTLSIDEELIPRAKDFAGSQGISLSQLIENVLRQLTSRDQPTFSARWRGRFVPAARNDERYRALAEKYL